MNQLFLSLTGLAVFCTASISLSQTLAAAPAESVPTLRRGNAWTEEAARNKLAEYAKSWSDRASWEKRATQIREGILRGAGLTRLPPRTPLQPIFRGPRLHDGYTVENVAFESLPGFFVTGNLYRPTEKSAPGKSPAVLVTHGHCTGISTPFGTNKTGGRFGGEAQRIAAVLARMGAVVFAYCVSSTTNIPAPPTRSRIRRRSRRNCRTVGDEVHSRWNGTRVFRCRQFPGSCVSS